MSIDQWGTIVWTGFNYSFYGCQNLQILAVDAPDLSNVVGMREAFRDCIAIGNADLSNWNVSNVVNMQALFRASNFNGNVSTWDVGNVLNFSFLFFRAPFNQDISGWNIGEKIIYQLPRIIFSI